MAAREREPEPRLLRNVRLNDGLRRTVLERLKAHSFKARRDELDGKLRVLGDEVYDHVYPKEVRRRMQALPEGFLDECESLPVSFAGDVTWVRFTEKRRTATKHSSHGHVAAVYEASHTFTARFRELDGAVSRLAAEESDAMHKAAALLASVTTTRLLLEAWPECRPFVEDLLKDTAPACVALAVPVAALNRAFGLGRKS